MCRPVATSINGDSTFRCAQAKMANAKVPVKSRKDSPPEKANMHAAISSHISQSMPEAPVYRGLLLYAWKDK